MQWVFAGMAGVMTGPNCSAAEAVLLMMLVNPVDNFELVRAAEKGNMAAQIIVSREDFLE